MVVTCASSSMAGATMRVGGFSALGGFVGVGVGLGRLVGVRDGGGAVTVHLGKRSGVGPTLFISALTARVGRGVSVGAGDGEGVGVAVGGANVGRGAAVSASTTAPTSEITGAGGALKRDHMPHPKPARINSPPIINMALERAGNNLFIV
jgi:hypothetical protein